MTAPTYLIASPGLRVKAHAYWERARRDLAAILPGVQFICWADLPAGFRDLPPAERPARLARVLSAAVIVPDKHPGHPDSCRWIGLHARTETEAFTAAGKEVHVYVARRLIPWADCQVRERGSAPRHTPLEVVIPKPGKPAVRTPARRVA